MIHYIRVDVAVHGLTDERTPEELAERIRELLRAELLDGLGAELEHWDVEVELDEYA
jgi:hypothetical protein